MGFTIRKVMFGALLTGAFSVANAATITQSVLTPQTPTSWGPAATALNQFDPALGTLTGVQLSWRAERTTNFAVNYGSGEGFANWSETGATVQATLPGLITLIDLRTPEGFSWTGAECGAAAACSIVVDFSKDGTSTSLIGSGFFPAYIGTGTFDLFLNANDVLDGFSSSGSFLNAFVNTKAGAFAQVIYTYDPVPEPGSLALLGLGLAGLAAARRRRR